MLQKSDITEIKGYNNPFLSSYQCDQVEYCCKMSNEGSCNAHCCQKYFSCTMAFSLICISKECLMQSASVMLLQSTYITQISITQSFYSIFYDTPNICVCIRTKSQRINRLCHQEKYLALRLDLSTRKKNYVTLPCGAKSNLETMNVQTKSVEVTYIVYS